VNIALAMAKQQKRVAILDADVFGPSIPRLMHLQGHHPEIREKYARVWDQK
jgi:ATP-binding protein involved in chromosome partitioning